MCPGDFWNGSKVWRSDELRNRRKRGKQIKGEKAKVDESEGEMWNCCLPHCERYLSISIKLQWRWVASAWGIVWDQLNLQVPANLMTPPKFNHATRAGEDLTSTKWHTGVSTLANGFLYERRTTPQQEMPLLMGLLATDCPCKCCELHDISDTEENLCVLPGCYGGARSFCWWKREINQCLYCSLLCSKLFSV